MYFIPSCTYSGVSLSLPKSQIHQVQCIYMPMLLTKLGFHPTFPCSIAFAPKHLCGLGITPFNVIIIQRKIKFLYKHLRSRTEIGKVIIINLQWAQVQAGRVNPIFTSDDRIDYIENK